MRLKRQFSPPQNGQNKMGNEFFLLEKQGKSRNNITILFNIKTKDGGRTWETRSESIAFKDTTLRKGNFHKTDYILLFINTLYQHNISS